MASIESPSFSRNEHGTPSTLASCHQRRPLRLAAAAMAAVGCSSPESRAFGTYAEHLDDVFGLDSDSDADAASDRWVACQ